MAERLKSPREEVSRILDGDRKQRERLRRCTHILPCESNAACDALTRRSIVSIRANHKAWSKSAWGNMEAHHRMSLAWHDLMEALGPIEDEPMAAIRAALGEERFRLLLNAYERLGGHVLEVPQVWSQPKVLP